LSKTHGLRFHTGIDDQFLKLTKKNKALEAKLLKKVRQILDNPLITQIMGCVYLHWLWKVRYTALDGHIIEFSRKSIALTGGRIEKYDINFGSKSLKERWFQVPLDQFSQKAIILI
jgi:hypothetical protein